MSSFVPTLATLARALLASGGALQSTAAGEQIDQGVLKKALHTHFAAAAAASPFVIDAAAADVVDAANRALLKTSIGRVSDLSDDEMASLEVIVQVIGRPALRYVDGKVQPPTTDTAQNERWHVFVVIARKQIDAVSASVARLGLRRSDGVEEHLGTAWRLGDDLLVTNRHVVRPLVLDKSVPCAEWRLDPGRPCIADFSMTDHQASASRRCVVASLAYCATEPAVDVAVLRLAVSAVVAPQALTLDFDSAALGRTVVGDSGPAHFEGEEIYVVGHPLQRLPTSDTLKVFGDADGRKRCSPGRTTAISTSGPVFEHDCSTLRGNSGSAVLTVRTHCVVGLHMGGHGANAAGTTGVANDAVAFANLGSHALAHVLRTGKA